MMKYEGINILYNKYEPEIESAKKILIDCNVSSLPIMVETIAEEIGIYVLPYSISFEKIKQLSLEKTAINSDGVSCIVGEPVIFYDDALPIERCRVTIGHEIGHIILHHVYGGQASLFKKQLCIPFVETSSEVETSANLFCEQLIAPPIILEKLNVNKRKDIEKYCGVNNVASEFILKSAAKRASNKYIKTKDDEHLLQLFSNYIKLNQTKK